MSYPLPPRQNSATIQRNALWNASRYGTRRQDVTFNQWLLAYETNHHTIINQCYGNCTLYIVTNNFIIEAWRHCAFAWGK